MEAFIGAGVKVLVTEMELSVLPWPKGNYGAAIETNFAYKDEMDPYKNGLPEEKAKEQNDFYIKLFDIYLRHSKDIGRVTFGESPTVTLGKTIFLYMGVRTIRWLSTGI